LEDTSPAKAVALKMLPGRRVQPIPVLRWIVATFQVHLFGKFNAHRDERELDCFPSAKAKELFCYLLLHRDRPHPRETLATLFWGECTPEQTRKYLRQTLWQLQHALHELSGRDCPDVMRVEKGSVRLDTGSDLWLDVTEFEQAFEPVKGVAGETWHGGL
jgi:DNA-binding SARP family transcriptional activator